ncbi:ObirOr5-N2 [Ooceraea biroi]|uniref:Odorant receptor n=4 Tax=Ooceraea biroi TaxID=2015173 RepID=A0A3L8DZQ2_OOCBI|nr:ObirOr5-N2 [Ooceraea biroi]
MRTNWNTGIDYGFSMIRKMMWILGVWPLQQNSLVCTFRWIMIFIVESLTFINVLIESFKSCGDVKDALEVFLIIETLLHAWTNTIFMRIYMKKIVININSAINDWSCSSMRKESYLIMIAYARAGRIVTLFQFLLGFLSAVLYFTSIIVGNKQQVIIIDNSTVVLWNFVFPSTCLFKGISYSTYKILFVMQIVQAFIIFIAECANDSFFFAITMHLCGQLELLKARFVELGRKIEKKNHCRNVLGPWIRRHYQLIILARNIEDAFNINILIRLSITTIVIAISGMHIIMSVRHNNYTDVIKSIIFIQYFILQSFLFTHAGDTLQNQSESIISAIYSITWHKLSSTTMKDLLFIMMRTKIPLQLSAGKFFYITRSTITNILRTALTYISFLQVTIKN